MSKIYQLPSHEAHKIAAGEVVDRPVNAVKELVENAIDAGATAISLYLHNGGRDSIRIVDNGCGMSLEDARLCILNHATSKIRSVNDLDSLDTFGFRGEALAAIASVSRMTLTTREQASDVAHRLQISEGAITHEVPAPAPIGTEIIVRDLFYNVPARQKFLKSRETEWRAIQQLCTAIALAHMGLDLQVYHDDRLMLTAHPAKTIAERVEQLGDISIRKALVTLPKKTYQDGSIHGVVTTSEYVRYDRSQIFIFVNRRWVKAPKIAQALMRGYLNTLPSDRFPYAALFIELDPSFVDVNMHPRKEEVQFLHPRRVEQTIEQAVRAAFEERTSTRLNPLPAMIQQAYTPAYTLPSTAAQVARDDVFSPAVVAAPSSIATYSSQTAPAPIVAQLPLGIVPAPMETLSEGVQHELFVAQIPRVIGQLHRTYIQLETPEGLLMVDQHAAHERILYERFEVRFTEMGPIALAIPEVVTVLPADIPLVEAHAALFGELGFVIEQVGPSQCAVTHVPLCLERMSATEFVHYLLGLLHELHRAAPEELKKQVTERMRAQMACKAAVKGGDVLNHDEMIELIARLYETKNRFSCPHGRPTSWLIARTDIERRFRRT